FPRVYLDADIEVTPGLVRRLAAATTKPGVLAAVPRPVVDTSGSTWPVRAFYAINSRLPVYTARLFGRGVVTISATGRARFARFPDTIPDDMLLDAVIGADEKVEIDETVQVVSPRTFGELVRRVARSRGGNDQFHAWVATNPPGVRIVDPARPSSSSWLRD